MKLLELRHPFFRPLWRRIAVVAVTLGWAVLEIATGNVFWAILFGSLGLYCAWEFFVAYDPANYQEREKK